MSRSLTCLTLTVVMTVAGPIAAHGQTSPSETHGADPSQMFDFLIGDWTYSFEGGGGVVTYERIEASGVIRETLDGHLDGRHFSAASVMFYSESDGRWDRRWVDSFGFVIRSNPAVVEDPAYDEAVVASTFRVSGTAFRHVWFDIEADRYNTDLYISSDGGETYTLARRAPYVRSSPAPLPHQPSS